MKKASRASAVCRLLRGRVGSARLAVVTLALLFWELAARWWIDPQFLSPPSRVLLAMPRLFETPGLPAALWTALLEFLAAFAISIALGLAIGLPIGLSRLSRRSFLPIVLFLYGIPQITILPLLVLWLGIGPLSKIAFGASHGVFPIIVNVVAGVQNIRPIFITAARSMGAKRRHTFRWVIFPQMMPSFFAGLRLGISGVLLGVLLAELYVSAAGIGYFTQMFTQSFDPSRLLGLIAVLAAMAIAMNVALRHVEMHFTRRQAAND